MFLPGCDGSTGRIADRIMEIGEWLAPLKKVTTFDIDCLPELIASLKQYHDDILDMPKGLITTLRLIKYLAIDPASSQKLEGKRFKLDGIWDSYSYIAA